MELEKFLEDKKNITINEYNMLKVNNDPIMVDFFFINEIFNIKIVSSITYHKEHNKWKNKIFSLFDNKCCITKNNCNAELNACHIEPFSINSNFDIYNGLVLSRNLHSTYDLYYWSINPKNNIISCNFADNTLFYLK